MSLLGNTGDPDEDYTKCEKSWVPGGLDDLAGTAAASSFADLCPQRFQIRIVERHQFPARRVLPGESSRQPFPRLRQPPQPAPVAGQIVGDDWETAQYASERV